ncbi:hypothetical protein [Caballeronia sp. KNU42]
MFDAEIAATLLNRWNRKTPGDGCGTYLDLLREGNLDCARELGDICVEGNDASSRPCKVESLVFGDGSRAVRIGTPDSVPNWTRWAPLEPAQHIHADASTHDAMTAQGVNVRSEGSPENPHMDVSAGSVSLTRHANAREGSVFGFLQDMQASGTYRRLFFGMLPPLFRDLRLNRET